MSILSKSIEKNFLLKAGVLVDVCQDKHEKLMDMLYNRLLTPERINWFQKNYKNHILRLVSNTDRKYINSSVYVNDKQNWCLWDIFAFNLLKSSKNEQALLRFNEKKLSSVIR